MPFILFDSVQMCCGNGFMSIVLFVHLSVSISGRLLEKWLDDLEGKCSMKDRNSDAKNYACGYLQPTYRPAMTVSANATRTEGETRAILGWHSDVLT